MQIDFENHSNYEREYSINTTTIIEFVKSESSVDTRQTYSTYKTEHQDLCVEEKGIIIVSTRYMSTVLHSSKLCVVVRELKIDSDVWR